MKTLSLALALFVPAAGVAAQFEGKVGFKISTERGQAQEMAYQIKNDKMRVEMGGQRGGSMIIDLGKKQSLMLMDEQRMFMVMDLPDVAAQAAQAAASDNAKLEKAGEVAKILGYAATKYIATHEGKKTELWLAEGLGTFMSVPMSNPLGGPPAAGGAGQGWERALAGKELFPLRVVGYDARGQENFRMEVTAIEKKSLPETLFAPPAGYQKFDLGGMMPGLMPGGRPGQRR